MSKPRTKITPARITGRIADWKGKFGWIQPDKPISHPESRMHKGQVYLSQMDVEAEISGIGAHVSFFVYADGSGLGAMNCRPAGSVPVQSLLTKMPQQYQASGPPQAFAGKSSGKGSRQQSKGSSGPRTRVSSVSITGQVKVWKGGHGWLVPTEPVKHPLFRGQIYLKGSDIVGVGSLEVGQTVSFFLYSDNQGLGAESCQVVDDMGAPMIESVESEATPAPQLSNAGASGGKRERITVVPTTGEVSEWKGSFGFIRPHEAVDHPEATKREGKVYVAKRDVVGTVDLSAGQLVQFHVFVDNSGLGAEECMPF